MGQSRCDNDESLFDSPEELISSQEFLQSVLTPLANDLMAMQHGSTCYSKLKTRV